MRPRYLTSMAKQITSALRKNIFDFLLSLDFVLMQVVGHSAVVLVRSRNGWLLNFLHLRVHLVYGLLDVRLDEVLFMSRGQLVDVDGFGDGALDLANLRNMLLMLEVVLMIAAAVLAIIVYDGARRGARRKMV